MNTLQNALVALSLTDDDGDVLRYAAMLHGAGVVRRFEFVSVVSPHAMPGAANDPDSLLARMKAAVAAVLPTEIEASPFHLPIGPREDLIAEQAHRSGLGLILLGHRPQGRGRRSLARRLAMIAPASVWMVPHGAPIRLSRALAPIDFSAHSADSLSIACGLSSKFGLPECDALHVYFDPSALRFEDTAEFVRGREIAAFEQFVHPLETFNVRVNPLCEESSSVVRAIHRTAEARNVDLIVMNTRGRSPAAAVLIGSETSQVLMESQVPVLAVKHRGAHLNLFEILSGRELWSRPANHTN